MFWSRRRRWNACILVFVGCGGDGQPVVDPPVSPSTEPDVPVSLEIAILDHPALVHAKELQISLDPPSGITTTCTLDEEPEEMHVVVRPTAAEHAVRLHGLLADRTYRCTVDVTEAGLVGTSDIDVITDPIPWDDVPTATIFAEDQVRWGHYTLINHWRAVGRRTHRLFVLDPEGRIRWSWTPEEARSGGIEAHWDGTRMLVGGGQGISPQWITLWGEEIYRIPDPFTDEPLVDYHHEALTTPDGHLVGLANTPNFLGEGGFSGFSVSAFDPETDALVFGYTSQTAIDAGDLGPDGDPTDPFHANAVLWVDDAEGSSVWVSLNGQSGIARIDRDSHALTWILGPGHGDFRLVDPTGAPLPWGDWFHGQHAPELDGDRLLVHDNGIGAGVFPQRSRAIELQLDLVARTATLTWSFTREGWYEPHYGDIDRLPNGNIMVASGHCADCGGTQPAFVAEVDPSDNTIVWEMRFALNDSLYRAQIVHGCDLFANTRYCPVDVP